MTSIGEICTGCGKILICRSCGKFRSADAEWQPIATKPAWTECEERGVYTNDGDSLFYFKATHWRPLPMIDAARAAIEAMREPTEEMINAGMDNVQQITILSTEIKAIWQAMIDAALKEKQ